MHEELVGVAASHITSGAVTAALLIFLASYGAIISEKIHRTIVAIFGGALMIIVGIFMDFYSQDSAIGAVDFNTIGLLIGMMIIVGITKDTGLFQYVAIKSAKLAKGNPWKIMLMFAIITAVFSALLDNVTTVMLMVPMTLVIADHLRVNPIPFLFVEIFMSNIGGTATLIGDPPNILIGSAANLSFLDFALNLAPVSIIIFIVMIPVIKFFYKKQIQTSQENMDKIMKLNERDGIQDVVLLKKSLFVLALVVIGFFLHGWLHMEGATIAIMGAGLLLLLDNKNPEKALHEVEWITIFFFIGLFVIIGGLEHVGVIGWAADKLIEVTNGSLAITAMAMLWGGAIFSAFVDNIPFVATMIPLVQEMHVTTFTETAQINTIWWSLALGACLGGNGTLVGASANLVVAGMAEKSGYKIGFMDFMKMGLLIMFISILISTVYVWMRYL
ncbi:MAG: ArsB/NhaD family transporter [Patescibacteria group bacterium]|jgi:Na+/H+ antiporter NhaD/arsenite permease-like protein|nr:ArsB/NhaD family transporter [Patescibacteria group bacterium]